MRILLTASLVFVGSAACVSDFTVVEPDAPGDAGGSVDAGATLDAGARFDAGVPVVDAGAPLAQPNDGGSSCAPCLVTGPGTFCGINVTITPFSTGGVFGGFQSTPGNGASSVITVTLSAPINWVSVTLSDPDFDGNMLRAFDPQGGLVSQVDFPNDGTPGVLTQASQGTGGGNISRVELVPAPADYVAYDQLKIIPQGCDKPDIN